MRSSKGPARVRCLHGRDPSLPSLLGVPQELGAARQARVCSTAQLAMDVGGRPALIASPSQTLMPLPIGGGFGAPLPQTESVRPLTLLHLAGRLTADDRFAPSLSHLHQLVRYFWIFQSTGGALQLAGDALDARGRQRQALAETLMAHRPMAQAQMRLDRPAPIDRVAAPVVEKRLSDRIDLTSDLDL